MLTFIFAITTSNVLLYQNNLPNQHKLAMTNSLDACRATIVVPFHLQVINHVYLRYPQARRIRIELDPRQSSELISKENLLETAANVKPTRRDRCILFHYKHLLLEHGIVAVS
jgi:hypothetical protein